MRDARAESMRDLCYGGLVARTVPLTVKIRIGANRLMYGHLMRVAAFAGPRAIT